MSYTIPRYIAAAAVDDARLRYKWDDWRASEDFEYEPDEILEKLAGLTLRAKIAAGIGMYEWVVWRLRPFLEDTTPLQIAEAAWCANVHRDYMRYVELDRDQWLGPIRGPLWCAVTWLIPLIFDSDDNPEEWESGLSYLCRLAVHVLPKPELFEKWLDLGIERLTAFYTAPPDDPFDDLFGEREEERRGPLVSREALDPDFDYKPELAPELIKKYLREVDCSQNPFLRSPEEMIAEGFSGTPYLLESVQEKK